MPDKHKEDAINKKLIRKRENKKQIEEEVKKVGLIIALLLIAALICFKLRLISVALLLCGILTIFPFVKLFSIYGASQKIEESPYIRTKKGKELNRKIEGLREYLKDYTSLEEKEKEDVILWDEYLVYSVIFNQNKKIINEYRKYVKK